MDQEKNSSLMEKCFIKASITDDISASSVLKYRDSIKKFFSIIKKDITCLNPEDFEKFILQMKHNGASGSRIANVISAIKWLLLKIKKYDLAIINIDMDKIKKPGTERKEVAYLTENEIVRFLDAIRNDIEISSAIRKIRMMALVTLLLQTGARIGEALSIKISDIDRINMEIPIIGKGGKPRSLLISQDTLWWIDKYLETRKSESNFLFVTTSGKTQWKQTDVGRVFRRYKQLSGITKPIVLHTLRHTTATQLTLKGAPLNVVQHILGHSRLETTMRYYIGAVEKNMAKKVMQDEYYRFIPKEYAN